jgi:SAM-dependent methyltransferase
MLRNAGVPYEDFTFVDLGSGKGRVCLVASEFPFVAVHGVDISPPLCQIARRNGELYKARACRDFRIHCQDASRFQFPAGNLFVYLYHSFDVKVTVALLKSIDADRSQPSRRVVVAYLVYHSDVESVRVAFAQIPWLRLTRFERSVTGAHEWLFYAN